MSHPIKLIIGLGNPGSEYENTRHNAGAWFIKALGASLKLDVKHHAQLGKLPNSDCRVAIPTTYMNDSGLAVASLVHYFKLPVESVLVAHDELDLATGITRLKYSKGHAGHNGLRDIIQKLGGATQFLRLRIGIDHPDNKSQVTKHVLSAPKSNDKQLIMQSIDTATFILPELLAGNIESAMQTLHSTT